MEKLRDQTDSRLWPALLLSCVLVMSSLVGAGCAQKASSDADTLNVLKQAGSDLTKPHQLIFAAHVPTEEFAKQAKSEMDRMGLFVQVKKEYDSYLCEGSRTMVPKVEDIGELSKRMQALADKFKGTYDGWRATVVR